METMCQIARIHAKNRRDTPPFFLQKKSAHNKTLLEKSEKGLSTSISSDESALTASCSS